jgi:hypothetical protein
MYLCIYLSVCLFVCLSVYLSTYLSFYLSIYLSLFIYRPIYLASYLSIWPRVYLSILSIVYSVYSVYSVSVSLSLCLSTCLSIYLSIDLSMFVPERRQFCATSVKSGIWHFQNKALLRDFLTKWTFTASKRNTARLPPLLNLTASKAKQSCDTSFKNGKLSADPTALYQCGLCFFSHSMRLKYCACQEKSEARSYEVLHLSCTIT